MIDLSSISARPSLINTDASVQYPKMWFTVIWRDGRVERAKQVFAADADEAIQITKSTLQAKYQS